MKLQRGLEYSETQLYPKKERRSVAFLKHLICGTGVDGFFLGSPFRSEDRIFKSFKDKS